MFYLAPSGGFAAGGVVGVVAGALFTRSGEKAFQWAAIGAAGGLAIGLGASLVYALTRSQDAEQPAARDPVIHVGGTPDAFMFSYGGAF